MQDKYYIPSFNEFVEGFKCETCYSMFTESDEEWVEIEMTKEFLDTYLTLIKADAYETEFRAVRK